MNINSSWLRSIVILALVSSVDLHQVRTHQRSLRHPRQRLRHWKSKLIMVRHRSRHSHRDSIASKIYNPVNDFVSKMLLNGRSSEPRLLTYNSVLSPTKPDQKPWNLALLSAFDITRRGSTKLTRSLGLPLPRDLRRHCVIHFHSDPRRTLNPHYSSGLFDSKTFKMWRHVENKDGENANNSRTSSRYLERSNQLKNTPRKLRANEVFSHRITSNINTISSILTSRKQKRQASGASSSMANYVWQDACQSTSLWTAKVNTTDIRNQAVTVLATIDVVGIQVHQFFYETFCRNEGSSCRGMDSATVTSKCQTRNIWTYAFARSILTGEVGWTQIPIRGSCSCAIKLLNTTPADR